MTIPASLFAKVTPSVLSAGGDAVDVIGLVLTDSTRVPIGTIASFPGETEVGDYFGPTSKQATFASVYFAGYTNATAQPGALLYVQYPKVAVSGYLRGGNISALPLTTLQSYNGTLNVTIDSVLKTASINLSAATSFSNAAEIIGQALAIEGVQAATLTASVGGTFTCTSAGTALTVSAVLTGSLQPGDTVTGTDGTNSLPGSTTILGQVSGTPGGTGVYTLSAAATPGNLGSCTVTSASTVLNVTAVATGALSVADVITGTSVPANTYIGSLGTGTGGTGTYNLSGTQHTIGSEAMTAFTPAVQYDSVSGAFTITSGTTGANSTVSFGSGALGTDLLLTQATGAVLSPGAAAAVPAAFMNGVTALTTDWVTFTTDFNPDASGNTVKQAFAAWNTTQDDEYAYIAWDTDITPTQSVPATTSLGYILQQNGNSGTCPIYEPTDLSLAAFLMGAAASINYNQPNGRATFAFKGQAGITASVTSGAAAVNLGGNPQVEGDFGNGYNYYGAVGAANEGFLWFQRGTVTGPFKWLDSYINQIVLNSAFQAAALVFFGSIGSVPFNNAGAGLIEQALAPVIQQYGDPAKGGFGAFAPGPISAAQISAVNNAAGSNIAGTLQTQGYYLQVLPQSSTVRGNRGPWSITFWYLDRGSVQSLDLSSIAVQ